MKAKKIILFLVLCILLAGCGNPVKTVITVTETLPPKHTETVAPTETPKVEPTNTRVPTNTIEPTPQKTPLPAPMNLEKVSENVSEAKYAGDVVYEILPPENLSWTENTISCNGNICSWTDKEGQKVQIEKVDNHIILFSITNGQQNDHYLISTNVEEYVVLLLIEFSDPYIGVYALYSPLAEGFLNITGGDKRFPGSLMALEIGPGGVLTEQSTYPYRDEGVKWGNLCIETLGCWEWGYIYPSLDIQKISEIEIIEVRNKYK